MVDFRPPEPSARGGALLSVPGVGSSGVSSSQRLQPLAADTPAAAALLAEVDRLASRELQQLGMTGIETSCPTPDSECSSWMWRRNCPIRVWQKRLAGLVPQETQQLVEPADFTPLDL